MRHFGLSAVVMVTSLLLIQCTSISKQDSSSSDPLATKGHHGHHGVTMAETPRQYDTVLHYACRQDDPSAAWSFFAENEATHETIYQALQSPGSTGVAALDFCREILNDLSQSMVKIHESPNIEEKAKLGDLHTRLITLNSLIEEMEYYWEELLASATNVQLVITAPDSAPPLAAPN